MYDIMSFIHENLKDPGYYRENLIDAHSDHEAFSSYEALASGENELRMSLNGSWKFFHARNEAQVIPGFEDADYDCKPWADIPVPAHIQMEGYGVPQYCNIQYPWDGHEKPEIGEIPSEFNPVACYAKYFFVPEAMQGKRLFISFQGVESCVALWLNGHYVGFSSDSFTPHEFELTPFLVEGENKLACRVYRYCSGSWIEDQDFYRFSGIFRDVYLYAIPELHLQDIRIKTLLDDDYRDAVLETKLDVEGEGAWKAKLILKDGEETAAEAETAEALCRMDIENPKKWSSEQPNLYDLYIELYDAAGEMIEVVRQRVGFRRFEIKNGVMCLNGVRIVFKGTDRHDFCAETGRAITPEKIRENLLIMKRSNINAIRTSHYPNRSELYALCDELGLYVIDENNMESHGVWSMIQQGKKPLEYMVPGNREDWLDILLDRVNSTYQRDKNHSSILIWSCGNESMGGRVPYEMSRLFHKLDDTRLVHYEGVTWDPRYPETTDIESQMYTPVTKLREFLAEHREKPFILCEYVHAMGNSNGAMHKYTEYAYEEPLYQGGFIWDYIDQSIRTRDRFGNEAYLYGGDHPGEYPHDGNFCGNGILYGNGKISPKIQEVKYNYQNIVAEIGEETTKIVNRSMFTNTSEFDCVAVLARNGVEIAKAKLETDVPPLSEKEYKLPFGKQLRGGEYCVTLSFRLKEDTAWAEIGYEVAFAQGVYTVEEKPVERQHAPLKIVYGDWNLGVKGDDFEAFFSYSSGGLVGYRFGGKELIKGVPMPNFWRAPNDNDRGNYMAQRYAQWKIASLYLSHKYTPELAKLNAEKPVWENGDGTVSFRMIYGMPTTPEAQCEVTYTVHPCGRIDMKLVYDPVEGLTTMPEFGMLFRMEADYDQMKYYGLGPEENYWDRHSGAKLGIWKADIKDNLAHYLIPQESGNRTGVRWAEVTDFRGRGLRFTGDGMEFSALPWTPHELENALHENELPPMNYTIVRCALHQMGIAGDNS